MNQKIEHTAIKYLEEFYGGLDKHILEDYSGSIFYAKNSVIYLEDDMDSNRLWVDYNSIWADLMNIFGLPEFEIKPIVYKWAKKTYNISRKVPVSYFHRTLIPTGDTFEVYV